MRKVKEPTKQEQLEKYLNENNLEIEVNMMEVGNLEMLCASTLSALKNGTQLSQAVKIINK
jgi:hypothetical protein